MGFRTRKDGRVFNTDSAGTGEILIKTDPNHFLSNLDNGKIRDKHGKRLDPDKFVGIDPANVDKSFVHEIKLWADNDGEFNEKVVRPNEKNIARRMKRDDFKVDQLYHTKSFLDRVGKEAIDVFKESNSDDDENEDIIKINNRTVSADTKREIGKEIAESMVENAGFDVKSDRPKFKAQEHFNFPTAKENIEAHMRKSQ